MLSKRDKKVLLFVYGTLKRDGENHSRLKDSEFMGKALTKPEYTLIFINGDSPDVKNGGNQEVMGELYLVPQYILEEIDKYESPYKRSMIHLEDGQKAFAYFL